MTHLSKTENTVLRFLYEQNKAGHTEPSIEAICEDTNLTRQVVRRALRSLTEKNMVNGPPDLLQQTMKLLSEQDKAFEATAPGYAEHIILLASAISKADESFLADELGYDLEFVSLVGSRLRSSGVWVGDHLDEACHDEWCREGMSFYLDGAIATGDLVMVGRSASGERQWQMTPGGLSRGADIVKRYNIPPP